MQESVVRGQTDGPLTAKGRDEAEHLATRLAAKGGLQRLRMSSAKRTEQTAKLLRNAMPGLLVDPPDKNLLSWAMGELEGQPGTLADPKIANFVKHLPDVRLPGRGTEGQRGESFDDFRWRALPAIVQCLQDWTRNRSARTGILTHHRVVRLLKSWLDGGMSPFFEVDKAEFLRSYELGKPGSVWVLKPGDRRWSMTPVNLESNDRLEPGVYIVRHTSTALNSGGGDGKSRSLVGRS